MLQQEIQDLRISLEFTHQQLANLQRENAKLKLCSQTDIIKKEHKILKETVLDIQTINMHGNLTLPS